MNELITINKDGVAVVDSVTIAEGVQVQHKNVVELIRKYTPDFEAFGRVAFQTRPFETAGGMQKKEVAWLNEDQTTLLFTFLKNTEIARKLKIRIVQAFRQCRDELAKSRAQQIPQSLPEALRQSLRTQLDAQKRCDRPDGNYRQRLHGRDQGANREFLSRFTDLSEGRRAHCAAHG